MAKIPQRATKRSMMFDRVSQRKRKPHKGGGGRPLTGRGHRTWAAAPRALAPLSSHGGVHASIRQTRRKHQLEIRAEKRKHRPKTIERADLKRFPNIDFNDETYKQFDMSPIRPRNIRETLCSKIIIYYDDSTMCSFQQVLI